MASNKHEHSNIWIKRTDEQRNTILIWIPMMLCENELVISCRKTVCYNFVFDAQARILSPYLRILDWIQRWLVFISFCLYNWCFVDSVVFPFLSTDFNLIRKKIKGFIEYVPSTVPFGNMENDFIEHLLV